MLPVDLKEPWISINPAHESAICEQLAQALNPQHPLKSVSLRPIAQRIDRDDFLFAFNDGSGTYVVVHLTRSKIAEADQGRPRMIIYPSFQRGPMGVCVPIMERMMWSLPNQQTDPTLSSVTPPARQEPRPR
jgi:hypothetical protein